MNTLQKLEAARGVVRTKSRFITGAVLNLIPVETPGLGTLAVTDRYVMMYDPAAVETWPLEQLAAVVRHEVEHPLRGHHKRGSSMDPQTANLAMDMAINYGIRQEGYVLPEGAVFPETYGFPGGLSMEQYYSLLMQKQAQESDKDDQSNDSGDSGQSDSNSDSGQSDSNSDSDQSDSNSDSDQSDSNSDSDQSDSNSDSDQSEQNSSDGQGSGSPDGSDSGQDGTPGGQSTSNKPGAAPCAGHCGSCAGNPVANEPTNVGRSEVEVERIKRQVAEAVKREIAQRGIGAVPANWAIWADASLGIEKVKWQKILAQKVQRAIEFRPGATTHSYKWFNRHQAAIGYGPGKPILAGSKRKVPRIAVAIDTSGSMGSTEIKAAITETHGVLKNLQADVEILACDMVVHQGGLVRQWKQIASRLKGGGGTDFRPVFDELAKRPKHKRPEILIYMTDGAGYCHNKPPEGIRTIWVIVSKTLYRPIAMPDYTIVTWGEIIHAV